MLFQMVSYPVKVHQLVHFQLIHGSSDGEWAVMHPCMDATSHLVSSVCDRLRRTSVCWLLPSSHHLWMIGSGDLKVSYSPPVFVRVDLLFSFQPRCFTFVISPQRFWSPQIRSSTNLWYADESRSTVLKKNIFLHIILDVFSEVYRLIFCHNLFLLL